MKHIERDEAIARAVRYCDGKWPYTKGCDRMQWRGYIFTRAEFEAAAKASQGERS